MHFKAFHSKCTGRMCLQVWPGALRTKTQWRLNIGIQYTAHQMTGRKALPGEPLVEGKGAWWENLACLIISKLNSAVSTCFH